MPGPIKPEDVVALKVTQIPDEVFEVFNNLIAQKFSGKSATVRQDDAMDLIVEALGVSRQTIFDNNWLDVEEAYEEQGWKVYYDKPAYNETYPATFEFSKP